MKLLIHNSLPSLLLRCSVRIVRYKPLRAIAITITSRYSTHDLPKVYHDEPRAYSDDDGQRPYRSPTLKISGRLCTPIASSNSRKLADVSECSPAHAKDLGTNTCPSLLATFGVRRRFAWPLLLSSLRRPGELGTFRQLLDLSNRHV